MDNYNIIETDRLLIRIFEIKDKELFYKYRSMPEIYKYQSWSPKNIREVEDFIIVQLLQKYKTTILPTNDLKKEMDELTIYLDMYKEAFYKSDHINCE